MRKYDRKNQDGFMAKRAFLAFLFVAAVFATVGMAQTTQVTYYFVRFKAVKPFALESNAPYAVPAGEYMIREVSILPSPGHLFSLDRASDKKSMAVLSTVRVKNNSKSTARGGLDFDYEISQLPVLKKFFVQGTDGWQIINVEYKKDAGLIDTASLNN
jgi:hypothetical protein